MCQRSVRLPGVILFTCSGIFVDFASLYGQGRVVSEPPPAAPQETVVDHAQLVCHIEGAEFVLDVLGGEAWLSKSNVVDARSRAHLMPTTRAEELFTSGQPVAWDGNDNYPYAIAQSIQDSDLQHHKLQHGWGIRAAFVNDGHRLEFQLNVTSLSTHASAAAQLSDPNSKFQAKVGVREYGVFNEFDLVSPFEWLDEQAPCRHLGEIYVQPKKICGAPEF